MKLPEIHSGMRPLIVVSEWNVSVVPTSKRGGGQSGEFDISVVYYNVVLIIDREEVRNRTRANTKLSFASGGFLGQRRANNVAAQFNRIMNHR